MRDLARGVAHLFFFSPRAAVVRDDARMTRRANAQERLTRLREKIDGVDDALMKLLVARFELAAQVGVVKSRQGLGVVSAPREQAVLARVAGRAKGALSAESAEDIYRTIINQCRLLQRRLTVSYFGPEATFTHQAAVKQFSRSAELVPARSISDVFADVEKDRADYGVVPVENSTEGMVTHTLDMFLESDLVICAERVDAIHHCLLAASDGPITSLHSHPQALAQCRKWLEGHLPGVKTHEAASTAEAARLAAKEPGAAAIAGPLAAELYGLTVLARGLQDAADNRTRFFVIGKQAAPRSRDGKDKTSILVSASDRVGALHGLLSRFKKARINLSRIESRPTRRRAWEYVFFIDFFGHLGQPAVARLLAQLAHDAQMVKVLGSYRRADER